MTQPPPVYPPAARQSGIQGNVLLAVLVGKDGTVQNINAISGPPALAGAAMDAVRHWVYQPTLLNGQRVEVLTTVNVNFALTQ